LIGSLTLLFVSGVSLSMSSILGFLVLVGTVVNNGILFVGTTNQYCEEMPVVEAIFKAARTRLRPILMTTMTTTLAIVPMALGIGRGTEMMQGLGIVVIGGLTASTLLSLLLLPIFYLIMKGRRKGRSERGNAEKPRAIEEAGI
jgi:multidrug efflux pump subunit AcrB